MNLRNAVALLALVISPGLALSADDLPVLHYLPPEAADNGAPGKAVSAVLVQSAKGQWPDEGDVKVTYSDRTTAVVTSDGRACQPKVVGGGIVGWVENIGQDPKYGREKTVLVLKMPDGTTKPWEGNAIYIFGWGLTDGDSHLVIKSMEHHGHDFYIEYNLKSGQKLAEVDEYMPPEELPQWAQSIDKPKAPQIQPRTPGGENKPVVGDPSQLTADSAADLEIKKKLLGYWASPRHGYCYATDGIIYMMNGASSVSAWDVRNGVLYVAYDLAHPEKVEADDIVSLTPEEFKFRPRGGANPTTFTEKRSTQAECEAGID